MNYFSANKTSKSLIEAVEAAMASPPVDHAGMLLRSMQRLLSDSFILYFQIHQSHWNVEGIDFPQFHGFFGDLYEEVYDKLDDIAEKIRTLGAYTPRTLGELLSESSLHGIVAPPPAIGLAFAAPANPSTREMVEMIRRQNQIVISDLSVALMGAKELNNEGLQNFLQDMIDRHNKIEWKLTATLKG